MKRFLMLLTLLLVTAGLVGCGSDNSGASGTDGGFVATGGNNNTAGSGDLVFNFIQAQDITVPVGTVRLKFEFFDAGNTVLISQTLDFAAQIIFENVSTEVVRVEVTAINADGYPIASGTTNLTIEDGSEQTVALTINPVTLDTLVVSPLSVGLVVGGTQQLTVQGFFSNGFIANISADAVTYSGNDAGIATVSNAGLVTAVAVGSTSVTVSYTVAGTTTQTDSSPVPINVVGGAIALTGTTNTFDTDTGELNGMVHPGWDGTVLRVESFDAPQGTFFNVSGSAAFQLTTSGDITIAGTVDLAGLDGGDVINANAAAGGTAGPGGFDGGRGGGFDIPDRDGVAGSGPGAGGGAIGATTDGFDVCAGGGGAGHLVVGNAGGESGTPMGQTAGTAGAAYSSIPETFVGGSGGGGGATEPDGAVSGNGGAGGGGGGGAGRFTAMGTLSVAATGLIDASGGDGGNGGAGGGGGAGSGGSLELYAPLLPTVDGNLNVSGGNGGNGVDSADGGDGSDGRTLVQTI